MTDISTVSKLDGNGIVVEWTKVNTLVSGSFGQVHLAKLPSLDSNRIVKCFRDVDLVERYGGNIPEPVEKCYTKMLLEGLRCIHGKELYGNGIVVEWTNVKTLGSVSFGQVHLSKFPSLVGSFQVLILKCLGDVVSLEKGVTVYNLFLEYAFGGTLRDLIERYGSNIPEPVVKCYTKMLLEGLRCIHGKGYVHCDLKPENILVFPRCDSDLNLKIVGFGLVRHVDENHVIKGGPKKLKFPGTQLYMPLETIVKRQIGHALDIWSLGCIVLEMITVKQPWDGTEDKMVLAIKILFLTSPPNQIPKTFSDQGKDFLMKYFAREPDERWTADMLLSHPFITATQEKSDDCLPSAEEIEAWLCDMSIFVE
ncbi:hypothetical protein V6N11_028769 [Hibiscus sabdariffa]|uniref:Protein kinase domain-containing protein n=1 Tax=Hibiscus sabdariffa TaxID=183260 RepID=A0ABR2PR26_9ROSI